MEQHRLLARPYQTVPGNGPENWRLVSVVSLVTVVSVVTAVSVVCLLSVVNLATLC